MVSRLGGGRAEQMNITSSYLRISNCRKSQRRPSKGTPLISADKSHQAVMMVRYYYLLWDNGIAEW